MTKRIAIPSLIILCAAELFASWGVWVNFPTDSVRVRFPGYWSYEVLRFGIWFAILAAGITALAVYRRKSRDDPKGFKPFRGSRKWVAALCGGLVLESITSFLYWLTPRSAPIRDAYEGWWYWEDRGPRPADLGLPSFVGYWKDHAIAWAVVTIIGSLIWLACSKLRPKHHRVRADSAS